MSLDLDTLGLTDLIRLQNQVSAVLARRFERSLALVFSDIVESTSYFVRYGDQAGRCLQQQHFDLLDHALRGSGGRMVGTAGDGAFVCFPRVIAAVEAFTRFQHVLLHEHAHAGDEQIFATRIGIHWGPVLTDGDVVTGDAVNLCARVAASAAPGEIRLTKTAFMELPNQERLRCRPLPSIGLKGIPEPVELMELTWRHTGRIPTAIVVEETGLRIPLPNQATITFGRLRDMNGMPANDIVLTLPDHHLTQLISRWHFQLHRRSNGFMLRSVSNQLTEVNGRAITKDEEVAVDCHTVVRLSRVMTLRFEPALPFAEQADDTVSCKPA